jgi:uncharacterized protein (DUF427 family)
MGDTLLESIQANSGITTWWPAAEPSSRWVRVRLGDITIAESRSPQLLLQYGPPPFFPMYYFTPDEILSSVLVDSEERPDGSTVWAVQVDEKRIESGAWTHPDPTGPLNSLADRVTFGFWDGLAWYEEAERMFAHARDPHKRVDVIPSTRHVEVFIDGTKLASSTTPMVLFETMLPTRFYLPPEDVRLDLLTASETVSACPYKGVSRHWSYESHADIAWSYSDPVPENPRIKDLVCFYNEAVDLVVDGELLPRPETLWSK